MKRFLAALIVACAVLAADGRPLEAGHKYRAYYYAPPTYYMAPPVVVVEPRYVAPPPVMIHRPVSPYAVYHPPVYGPRRFKARYPVWPRGEVEVKYKRRWYGYKIEYDYDD